MAVEARRLNIFPSLILRNRGTTMVTNAIGNAYAAPAGYGVVAPSSGTTTATDNFIPMYGSSLAEAVPAKGSEMKSDSGLSYAVPVSRKRSRDAMATHCLPNGVVSNQIPNNLGGSFAFLGEDFSLQFQQQQQQIDRFIAEHTEKLRAEVNERWKRHSRRISAAVEETVMKSLRAKEDEIVNMGKINWALEERVKSLCVENQIWRDLGQANEATANALRCNLEQVLARVQDEQAAAIADDAQSSCCGSNLKEAEAVPESPSSSSRLCRSCGKEESCVVLLPCRHLCLCTFCGSSIQACPVCNSTQTATVHVNLSPL